MPFLLLLTLLLLLYVKDGVGLLIENKYGVLNGKRKKLND
jgi:hypothetical protein